MVARVEVIETNATKRWHEFFGANILGGFICILDNSQFLFFFITGQINLFSETHSSYSSTIKNPSSFDY